MVDQRKSVVVTNFGAQRLCSFLGVYHLQQAFVSRQGLATLLFRNSVCGKRKSRSSPQEPDGRFLPSLSRP